MSFQFYTFHIPQGRDRHFANSFEVPDNSSHSLKYCIWKASSYAWKNFSGNTSSIILTRTFPNTYATPSSHQHVPLIVFRTLTLFIWCKHDSRAHKHSQTSSNTLSGPYNIVYDIMVNTLTLSCALILRMTVSTDWKQFVLILKDSFLLVQSNLPPCSFVYPQVQLVLVPSDNVVSLKRKT